MWIGSVGGKCRKHDEDGIRFGIGPTQRAGRSAMTKSVVADSRTSESLAEVKTETTRTKTWWIVIGDHQSRGVGLEHFALRMEKRIKKTSHIRRRSMSPTPR